MSVNDPQALEAEALPTEVSSLKELLDVLHAAQGALSLQAEQISQMQGMFDDADGTIAAAVHDGEQASSALESALPYVRSLIEARSLDEIAVQMDHDIVAEAEDARKAGLASAARIPTALELSQIASDIADEYAAQTARCEDEDEAADVEVPLSAATAESLLRLLDGAARLAAIHATPIEAAVEIAGGVAQAVRTVADEARTLRLYIHDHDVDGRDRNPSEDPGLAHISFDDSPPDKRLDCSLAVWERNDAPTDGRFWQTLRAEAARLGEIS